MYTEAFEAACPYYLSLGMPWDLFWHGDPWAVRAYRESDRLSMRRADRLAWLQGLYVYRAMGLMAPAYRTFSKHGPRKYDPVPLMDAAEASERRREETLRENGRLAAMDIARWVDAFNGKAGQATGEGVGDDG